MLVIEILGPEGPGSNESYVEQLAECLDMESAELLELLETGNPEEIARVILEAKTEPKEEDKEEDTDKDTREETKGKVTDKVWPESQKIWPK